ncbi:8-amino-7-oxononanoate synthase [Alteromonas sp. KC3]|uniref:aminotransferase class I/II-fold pyridoxal phosphate-dependent enzyme n=1 Tax=unclassified Alteromonas TaxID=2614992 RepID=UPI001924D7D9|nr:MULTISPECIES: 8-amino-7-oxononanoate synthase [unclassified Alteromonas]BCO18471.1 8-amino-7-oxononanoate synthase [Alteromonas sp. KC3]BCO22432.1 8-amino-7-oxononanoate synthase [Alteromonas sp. KC14]
MAFNWLEAKLTERAQHGLLRQRHCQQYEKDNIVCINGEHYLNFSSNDYLGMRQHEGVLQSWVEGLAQFGAGSGASPLVTGHTQAHLALEAYIADGLNREAALLFNSGFAANQALCMALFSRHAGKPASLNPASSSKPQSHILADKLMHASFLEGAMCVGEQAQLRRFKHNDLTHLESLLQKRGNTEDNQDTLIVSEGVFSMDGDYAPSIEIAALAKQYSAWFMLDDAHGMGVLGENGFGTVEALGLTQEQVPIVMGTFGKAIGTAGAFIAGSQVLIDFLVNFAKHYVYSTAMPPAQAVATLYSLTHIASDRPRRDALTQNIMHLRDAFNAKFSGKPALTLADSNSAIQPIIVGCPKRAVALSEGLKRRGIWVTAIRYPTVPKNEDRLRVTLSANHTQQDIDVLLDAIGLAAEECRE